MTTPVSQDCKDILESNAKLFQQLQQMQVGNRTSRARCSKLPAGDLRFALGSSYRKDDYVYLPDQGMTTTTITSVVLGQFDTTRTAGRDRRQGNLR